jgi:hypothetical protein
MNIGLNTQANVRDAGFANQGARNAFNVGGANFNMDKAIYGDQYDRQQGQDIGAMVGKITSAIPGAITGGITGGPVGAVVGGLSGLSGEGAQWLDLLNQTKKKSDTGSYADGSVSTLGKINPEDFLKDFSKYKFGMG